MSEIEWISDQANPDRNRMREDILVQKGIWASKDDERCSENWYGSPPAREAPCIVDCKEACDDQSEANDRK